ncbi:MAG: hypothetical protein JXQ65_14965 [Candidatus Marinimicrobia bacterium]|nr:hypothetical protein [Candidatus Neomarinimicrobiota bacterium]
MSKKRPKSEKKQHINHSSKPGNPRVFKESQIYLVLFLALVLLLVFFYKPIVIDRLEPAGSDIRKNIGETSQYTKWEEESGELALWNPNIFLGIPIYFNLNGTSFNLDVLIDFLDDFFIDWIFSWLLVGAVGMFLLLRRLGFEWYISAIGALAFIFWPHLQGLISVGHNMKIRAICVMPLVLYAFLNYVKKRDMVTLLLFILILSVQIRTRHYQVIFYNLMALFFVGVYNIAVWVKEKEYKRIARTLSFFLLALVVSVLTAAKPLFVSREYTPHSTRGGNEITLKEQDPKAAKTKSGGVSFDYATEWSLAPAEMMTFISSRFFGGITQEPYRGDKYPKLKNHNLATYWGKMYFTMTTEYIGVILVILAFLGIWVFRKEGLVITFSILALFSLLLAFGKHFPILYKLFFFHVPYFDKFRAPVMTIILLNFVVIILAMYGFQALLRIDSKEKLKPLLIIAGAVTFLGLLFVLAPKLLSFAGLDDTRNAGNEQSIQILRDIRKDYMIQDNLRMVLLVLLFVGSVFLNYLKKIQKPLLIVIILSLIAFDSISVSFRYNESMSLYNEKTAENKYFPKTKFDLIFEQEQQKVRMVELGKEMFTNGLAFRYQTMAGYSAIKPQLIQDIFDNNFNASNNPDLNLNLPVISMCNVKYIVSPVVLKHDDLKFLSFDKQNNKGLYLNKKYLPRAFFIEQLLKFSDEKEVLKYMNTDNFDPATQALVSAGFLNNQTFMGKGPIELLDYTPNSMKLKATADADAFLVLSEAYYPAGWKCLIDEKETTIFQINHVLRGVQIPAGSHNITFVFEPESYRRAGLISNIFTYAVWLLLFGVLVYKNRNRLLSINKNK